MQTIVPPEAGTRSTTTLSPVRGWATGAPIQVPIALVLRSRIATSDWQDRQGDPELVDVVHGHRVDSPQHQFCEESSAAEGLDSPEVECWEAEDWEADGLGSPEAESWEAEGRPNSQAPSFVHLQELLHEKRFPDPVGVAALEDATQEHRG